MPLATQIPYIDIHTHRDYPVEADAVYSIKNIALNHSERITQADCSIGLHPWYMDGDAQRELELMVNALGLSQVLAIGECGMDKTISISLNEQQVLFDQQVSIAKRYQKPLIIHCVRAFQEVVACLKSANFKGPVIFHGYRKNETLAEQLVDQGYYLSLGKHCLNGSQDKVLLDVPLRHLFLETDTDTTVEIEAIYRYVAQVRSIELDELKEILYHNYKKVFNR